MRTKLFNALKVSTLALLLSFGLSFVYAWTAPTISAPGGNVSAPINTSATAQTKAGNFTAPNLIDTSTTAQTKAGWFRAVGGNGGDPASRIGVGNNWWMSENTNGNYAIHRNGVGDKLTMDTNGNVGLAGGLTLPAGGAITGSGANSSYGSLTVQGSKNGWSGINFPGAGTVMMHPSYSGFYNAADNTWRMLVTDTGGTGSMGNGNVYANDYYSYAAGKWMSSAGTALNCQTFSGGTSVSCPAGAGWIMTGASCLGNDNCSGNDSSAYGGTLTSTGISCKAINCTSVSSTVRCCK